MNKNEYHAAVAARPEREQVERDMHARFSEHAALTDGQIEQAMEPIRSFHAGIEEEIAQFEASHGRVVASDEVQAQMPDVMTTSAERGIVDAIKLALTGR